MRRLLCFVGIHRFVPYWPRRSYQVVWLPMPEDEQICTVCGLREVYLVSFGYAYWWRRG